MQNVTELEDVLSRPTPGVVDALAKFDADLMVLGAGGKMGPTLCRMAKRAYEAAGISRRVFAVSRFTNEDVRRRLSDWGVQTIACDLLDEEAIRGLPDAPLVMVMAGMKFGTSSGGAPKTWATNCLLPGVICRTFPKSRIAAFSSGNVYGLIDANGAGSKESDEPKPVGEYAMTTLGRERIFQHFSNSLGIPVALLRLNYAVELRYGVLVDLAQEVMAGHPIDVTMGAVNVIWQAEANAMALQAFGSAACPADVVNIAGPEILQVRQLAMELGRIIGNEPTFVGQEAPDALLSDGSRGWERWGRPQVNASEMMEWIVQWLKNDGPTLGKPTHFQSRDGAF